MVEQLAEGQAEQLVQKVLELASSLTHGHRHESSSPQVRFRAIRAQRSKARLATPSHAGEIVAIWIVK
jgi:hypothetical protein